MVYVFQWRMSAAYSSLNIVMHDAHHCRKNMNMKMNLCFLLDGTTSDGLAKDRLSADKAGDRVDDWLSCKPFNHDGPDAVGDERPSTTYIQQSAAASTNY